MRGAGCVRPPEDGVCESVGVVQRPVTHLPRLTCAHGPPKTKARVGERPVDLRVERSFYCVCVFVGVCVCSFERHEDEKIDR